MLLLCLCSASSLLLAPHRPRIGGRVRYVPHVSAVEHKEVEYKETARLYVGGIPFGVTYTNYQASTRIVFAHASPPAHHVAGMTEAEVARIFDGLALPHEVSPVVEVSLVLGHNGAPRGYGFVELASTVQAKRAQALMDGRAVSYDGRMPTTLVVREATPSKARQLGPLDVAGLTKPIAGRVLWVSNLCFSTRPRTVRAAFALSAGVPAESVRCSIVHDSKRRSRGFGTICLPDVTSASRALAGTFDVCKRDRRWTDHEKLHEKA